MKTLLVVLLIFVSFCLNSTDHPKAILCAACHGAEGTSKNSLWPNIAGQHASYLIKQMSEMKQNKTREASTMAGILHMLTEQDINDLANYYAKMPIAPGKVGEAPTSPTFRAQALYRNGDFSKRIPACITCHGPTGRGNSQAGFPVITGQHAEYTLMQLAAFKEGRRSNDINHIMRDISNKLSPEDMELLARYIEGLH